METKLWSESCHIIVDTSADLENAVNGIVETIWLSGVMR